MKNQSEKHFSRKNLKCFQILILFSFFFISLGASATKKDSPDYNKLWKKTDSLVEKGLTKSALEVVNQIYKLSKDDKSSAVFVKSVIYKIKLEQNLTEEFYSITIKSLNEEVKTSSMPVKPLIHTLLAEMYWRYYITNRNRFKNRTETISFKQEDIATWDLKKIINKTIEHFLKSIESADSLKKIPINTYDEIITKGDNSRKFRPTLYDFLAHRLIDFFMNDEPDIIRPSYKFEVNDPNFILPLNNFANYNLQSKDSFSLKFYALKTMQDLIKFHLNDADPTALIDIELQRLGYIRAKAVFDNKDSLYLDNLINLEKKFINSPASTEITYEIANYYFVLGSKYNPLASDENKWMRKKSFDKCKEAIAAYQNSDGGRNCSYLQDRILSKLISFNVENANLPNKPFRALLSYTNMKQVFVRVVPIDPDNFKRKRYDYSEDLIKNYIKAKPLKEWTINLQEDGDYQNHKVEINIPELPIGLYAILVGSDKDFSTVKEAVAYSTTWITNLSFISRKKENGNYDITVLNRDNGLPIKNVSAQTYFEKYNYVLRDYRFEKGDKFTTDQNGSFEIPAKGDDYSYFYIDFANGKDRIQSDYNFYQYRYYNDYNHEKVITTNFFLDRAIYRPGQTIFFKGIVLQSDSISTEIKTNFKSNVILYDVNYQKVGELNLTTNEYGSFNGSFVAPTGVLNGQMQISDSHGSVYF